MEAIEIYLLEHMSKALEKVLRRIVEENEEVKGAIKKVYTDAKKLLESMGREVDLKGVMITPDFHDYSDMCLLNIEPCSVSGDLKISEIVKVKLPQAVIKPPIPEWCEHFGFEGYCDSRWYFIGEIKAEIYKFADLLISIYNEIQEGERK